MPAGLSVQCRGFVGSPGRNSRTVAMKSFSQSDEDILKRTDALIAVAGALPD